MRVSAYFQKTFKENIREWKISILVLVFGPFFVYMMNAYFGGAAIRYTLLAVNRDRAPAAADDRIHGGDDLVAEWQKACYPDGTPFFEVKVIADPEAGRKELKNRDADLMLVIPADFSRKLRHFLEAKDGDPPRLTSIGDHGHARFIMAAALADFITYTFISRTANLRLPLEIDFQPIAQGRGLNEFDLYVPALLVLSIIMILFTAAASLIKEVDKGTITRLILSKLKTWEWLAAVAVNQVVIGTLALGLTYLAALHVGYRSAGSIPLFLLLGALCSLAVIAISIVVAAFIRTIFELLTVGVFPFFVLMFFSECMFPLPRITLLRLAGHTFYANDVLPTALTAKAFNKILNFQAGLGDLVFEIGGIVIMTLLYFALGVWLFRRRHIVNNGGW